MKKQKPKNIPDYEPEMTFQEIADEIGVTQSRVIELYNNALVKLQKKFNNDKNVH